MTHPRPVPIPRRFEGRTVVVTGAGTGFGAEIAVRAAQEGAKTVGIHYRSSRQGAEETADASRRPAPRRRSSRPTSSSGTSVTAFAEQAFDELGERRRGDEQRRRRGPRADVVARHHRGVGRPRPGRRHQGHDGVHRTSSARGCSTRVAARSSTSARRSSCAAAPGRRSTPRRSTASSASPSPTRTPSRRRAGQRLRARLHRDRGDAGPRGLAGPAAATSSAR